MGPAFAILNTTIANWLKETLILANIRATEGSTRNAVVSYAASQGASINTIIEAGDWAHISTMYGHYIKCLHGEVLFRIIE